MTRRRGRVVHISSGVSDAIRSTVNLDREWALVVAEWWRAWGLSDDDQLRADQIPDRRYLERFVVTLGVDEVLESVRYTARRLAHKGPGLAACKYLTGVCKGKESASRGQMSAKRGEGGGE